MDRTFIGSLAQMRQTLRVRAPLPAAGAFDTVSPPVDVQGVSRLTVFGDYERGAPGGSCYIYVEWSPFQSGDVPVGDMEWYAITAIEVNTVVPGTVQITEIQQAY